MLKGAYNSLCSGGWGKKNETMIFLSTFPTLLYTFLWYTTQTIALVLIVLHPSDWWQQTGWILSRTKGCAKRKIRHRVGFLNISFQLSRLDTHLNKERNVTNQHIDPTIVEKAASKYGENCTSVTVQETCTTPTLEISLIMTSPTSAITLLRLLGSKFVASIGSDWHTHPKFLFLFLGSMQESIYTNSSNHVLEEYLYILIIYKHWLILVGIYKRS